MGLDEARLYQVSQPLFPTQLSLLIYYEYIKPTLELYLSTQTAKISEEALKRFVCIADDATMLPSNTEKLKRYFFLVYKN